MGSNAQIFMAHRDEKLTKITTTPSSPLRPTLCRVSANVFARAFLDVARPKSPSFTFSSPSRKTFGGVKSLAEWWKRFAQRVGSHEETQEANEINLVV